MKYIKIICMTIAVIMGTCLSAFAYSVTPYEDVPKGHWAYEAINNLTKTGLVEGYGDHTFKGDKVITRYEMATIIAKAMAKCDKANAATQAAIDKLKVEFADDLKNQGVRLDKVEKRLDLLEKVSVNGKIRLRFEHEKNEGHPYSDGWSSTYLDMFINYKINDKWSGHTEMESFFTGNMGNDSDTTSNAKMVYVDGPAFGGKLTAGKFGLVSMYAIVAEPGVGLHGVQYEFGDKLKTQLKAGRLKSNTPGTGSVDAPGTGYYKLVTNKESANYRGAEFSYAASKVTNLMASYHHVGYKEQDFNLYELGFDSRINKDFTLYTTFVKSNVANVGNKNKGYWAQLIYKMAKPSKVGSSDFYVAYYRLPVYATISSRAAWTENMEEMRYGFDYVPMRNSKISIYYVDGKFIDTLPTATPGLTRVAGSKENIFRAQIEYYF